MLHWCRLDMHFASLARSFARLKAGSSNAARIAIIAITTIYSILWICIKTRKMWTNAVAVQVAIVWRYLAIIDSDMELTPKVIEARVREITKSRDIKGVIIPEE